MALKVFYLRGVSLARHIEETPGLSVERLAQRFRDEAALMAAFDYPHIVPVPHRGGLVADRPGAPIRRRRCATSRRHRRPVTRR